MSPKQRKMGSGGIWNLYFVLSFEPKSALKKLSLFRGEKNTEVRWSVLKPC